MTQSRPNSWTALALALLGGLATAPTARAQVCDASVSNVSFGDFDVTTGAAVDTTAQVNVSCTGVPLVPVRVCVNFGQGSGGGTDLANRLMTSGANSLRYSLFQDAARSIVWGTGLAAVDIVVSIGLGGTGSESRTVYGRIYPAQATAQAGTYLSTFTGPDAEINYGLLSIILNCGILVATKSMTFTATANIAPTCHVTANNLDFGSAGLLAAPIDGATTLAPICTNGTTYQIGLNGGLTGASDPTQRRMSKGAESILYGLYRDAARTNLPFGDTIGLNTLSGTGTGLTQSIPVYGRIPPQSTPSPGPYSDTVVVTVTY
jgi:spore coat protein U-like protein